MDIKYMTGFGAALILALASFFYIWNILIKTTLKFMIFSIKISFKLNLLGESELIVCTHA